MPNPEWKLLSQTLWEGPVDAKTPTETVSLTDRCIPASDRAGITQTFAEHSEARCQNYSKMEPGREGQKRGKLLFIPSHN